MIYPNIAEYEENDGELARLTIAGLHEEINRLNNIINEFNEFVEEVYNHINQGDESDEFMLIFDKWQELIKSNWKTYKKDSDKE